ncbi:MAG: hypothetical protein AB8B65_17120 [Kordia sp.]|uniref:hypothetical protein n=1 Tax=Kordia sp. TaxID=1965332 RepID=UPI00385C839C
MNKLEISGTVSFQETCQDRWQAIYFSSSYGTTFSILGKFKYDKVQKKLLSTTLRLVNYKGPINMAIASAKYKLARKWIEVKERGIAVTKIIRVISIEVEVRGLIITNVNTPVKNEYVLTDCDLKNDVYLEIDRVLLKLNDGGGHKENEVFDSEFFYRDGERNPHAFSLKRIEYMQARNLNPPVDARCIEENVGGKEVSRIERVNPKKEKVDNSAGKSPGNVCPKGYSKIIF